MGSVFFAANAWRFKYKDAADRWQTVTTKAGTKAEAKVLMREKECEAERQRLGLAPLLLNPNGWTVGDLMQWWLDIYVRNSEAHGKCVGTIRNHILKAPFASKSLEHVIPGDIEKLLQSKEGLLAPGTVNHVRQFLVRAFNKAKRAGQWFGANPAEEVETRSVPERVVEILRPEEVVPFFLQLDLDQRVVFGAAISSGLRKGELCGLLKEELDLPRRLLVARHSYARPFPKSKKQRVVRIPEEFVSFYEYALGTYPGPWLFRRADGGHEGQDLAAGDVLRRALKRAGVVTSYTHVCRRKTCRYTEERGDSEVRPCSKCGFKLWPKGNVRHVRFHDLRATYASALLMLGANLTSVQKLLGHSDPKITERRYGHLLPDFMKSEVDRLRFGVDQFVPSVKKKTAPPTTTSGNDSPDFALDGRRLGTPVVRNGSTTQEEVGTPSAIASEIPASRLAGCTGLEPVASGVTVTNGMCPRMPALRNHWQSLTAATRQVVTPRSNLHHLA